MIYLPKYIDIELKVIANVHISDASANYNHRISVRRNGGITAGAQACHIQSGPTTWALDRLTVPESVGALITVSSKSQMTDTIPLTSVDVLLDGRWFGALHRLLGRLRLQRGAINIATGVHGPLQSISLPAKDIIPVLAVSGPVASRQLLSIIKLSEVESAKAGKLTDLPCCIQMAGLRPLARGSYH